MKPQKEDRRSKRTRQLIGNALVELMLEKRFKDITVQDILDRANVGRSTFYTHYTDKENLLISEIARVFQMLDDYSRATDSGHHGLMPSLEFFRHVQQQRRLMRAFVWGKGAEILTHDFQNKISGIIEQNLQAMIGNQDNSSMPLSVVASFVSSTFLMLLRWWFDEDMQHTPEQMDEMFRKLVMPAIQGLLTR